MFLSGWRAWVPPFPDRNWATLASKSGFWRLTIPLTPGLQIQDPDAFVAPLFYLCPHGPIACPSSANGTCATGYGGVKCGVCEPGFHDTGTSCTPCVGATQYLLPIVLTGALIVGAIFIWVAQRFDTRNMVNVTKILVSYLQVMGSSSSSYKYGGHFSAVVFDVPTH